MCAAMGRASLLRFPLCACLLSPELQPTLIRWQRRWRPTLPSPGICWRSIIAATAGPNTIAIPTTTRFPSRSPTSRQSWSRSRPTVIAGVILNDIGPVIEPQGFLRVKTYVEKPSVPRNFEEGAEFLRRWFGAAFPKLTSQDWIAFARRTWREHRGRLVPEYDT